MCQARLGLKAQAWAWLWRTQACINPRLGPPSGLELGLGLAWAWAWASQVKNEVVDGGIATV